MELECVMIRQVGEQASCGGIRLTDTLSAQARKLEPGEAIPLMLLNERELARVQKGVKAKMLEVVVTEPTRPLRYSSPEEAARSSARYNNGDVDEKFRADVKRNLHDQLRQLIEAENNRMAEQFQKDIEATSSKPQAAMRNRKS